WWLHRAANDWGVPGSTILMTGRPGEGPNKAGEWVVPVAGRFTPYRVPELVVDPKVEGHYRIYVGLYHEKIDPIIRSQLLARLSRQPYPEYLRAPSDTKGRYAEVLWTIAQLSGQKLHISQPPAPM